MAIIIGLSEAATAGGRQSGESYFELLGENAKRKQTEV